MTCTTTQHPHLSLQICSSSDCGVQAKGCVPSISYTLSETTTRQRLWKSPRAAPTFRTLRCPNFAPCEVSGSHPAKFARRLGASAHQLVGSARGHWARGDARWDESTIGIPYIYKGARTHARARDIGVDFGVATRSMSESLRNIQWIDSLKRNHALANLHGSARQLAWFDFATCMVPLTEVHGWTSRSAWFGFRRCIVGLSKRGL